MHARTVRVSSVMQSYLPILPQMAGYHLYAIVYYVVASEHVIQCPSSNQVVKWHARIQLTAGPRQTTRRFAGGFVRE